MLDKVQESRVLSLLDDGEKWKAICFAKEQGGMSLWDAKSYVNGLLLRENSAETAPAPVRLDESHVRALLADGKKVMAVKFVRESTGVALKEAKDYVDCLEAMRNAQTPFPAPQSSQKAPDERQARALMERGEKLRAIRFVMQDTGMSLSDAKRYVEGLVPPASAPEEAAKLAAARESRAQEKEKEKEQEPVRVSPSGKPREGGGKSVKKALLVLLGVFSPFLIMLLVDLLGYFLKHITKR